MDIEIELAPVEVGEIGDAAAQCIEPYQVRVQRTDALGDRIHLALHLLARGIDRHALLLQLTRQLLTLQGSGDESPELYS